MRLLPDSLLYRIPILCGAFILLSLTVITIVVGLQQQRLLHQQMNDFGSTQARQLALAAEQPLFMRDIVSLQVVLENSATTDKVFQTQIRDDDERVLAESTRKRSAAVNDLQAYRAAVVLENETIGEVTVLLDMPQWRAIYMAPWWRLLLLNLLMVGLSALAALLFARSLTGKLRRLINGLPAVDTNPADDELRALEHRLEPLLTCHPHDQTSDEDSSRGRHYALLTCQLNNLARLRAQLSHENYQQQLQHFDHTLERISRLYQGERIRGRYGAVLIRFAAADSDGDHLQRALYCAQLISLYLAEISPRSGIHFDLRMVISKGYFDPGVTPLLQEQQDNDLEDRLFDMLDLGSGGEILLSADVACHPQLQSMGSSEEFSDADAVYRWQEFTEQCRARIDKQIKFLRSSAME